VAVAGDLAESIADMGYQLRLTHRDISL
jgi:hypothetical protein